MTLLIHPCSDFSGQYPEKAETRSSGMGRVGLDLKIRGFSGQKTRKKVENSIGSTLKFSGFLQALVDMMWNFLAQ